MNQFCQDTLNLIDDLTSLIKSAQETNAGINILGKDKEHLNVLYESLQMYESVIKNLPDGIKGMSR